MAKELICGARLRDPACRSAEPTLDGGILGDRAKAAADAFSEVNLGLPADRTPPTVSLHCRAAEDAEVHGLPWGHRLYLYVGHSERGTWGHAMLRLPHATGNALIGRLGQVRTV